MRALCGAKLVTQPWNPVLTKSSETDWDVKFADMWQETRESEPPHPTPRHTAPPRESERKREGERERKKEKERERERERERE